MEGSHDSIECCKSKHSNKRSTKDEREEEDKNGKQKNKESSSNSSVDEEVKKSRGSGSVRQYSRSQTPRLRWTPDLHLRFVHAIERLGGQDRATPKLVLQLMNIKGLRIAHVKSHLQMYRCKKEDGFNQEQGPSLFVGGDHHIYKHTQHPMLQTFIQRPSSSLRYGETSWRLPSNMEIYRPYMGETTVNRARYGDYGSFFGIPFGKNNIKSLNCDLPIRNFPFKRQGARRSIETREEVQPFHGSWQNQPGSRSMDHYLTTQLQERLNDQVKCLNNTSSRENSWQTTIQEEAKNRLKLKTSDSDCNIDLNLSLKIRPNVHEFERNVEGNEIDSSLSLSLSSSSMLWRLKGMDDHGKQARAASTRDLTF
ncbi:Myb_DNA-binding domain-containing protein [Cephalotus follicularis]|uniref:Myb_DNA-binding domain-containing protein n=1 Tax=Cephalotus follicularis TaxID=3775 RepID=A0A1Q3D6J3_CEPFO|nr:Myb_DNA-binding domain-containing protein [Cephalotus follicularis]